MANLLSCPRTKTWHAVHTWFHQCTKVPPSCSVIDTLPIHICFLANLWQLLKGNERGTNCKGFCQNGTQKAILMAITAAPGAQPCSTASRASGCSMTLPRTPARAGRTAIHHSLQASLLASLQMQLPFLSALVSHTLSLARKEYQDSLTATLLDFVCTLSSLSLPISLIVSSTAPAEQPLGPFFLSSVKVKHADSKRQGHGILKAKSSAKTLMGRGAPRRMAFSMRRRRAATF